MNRKAKIGIVLNIIGLAGVVAVNILANSLPINGMTTGELSALYPNLFVPAGLTFSIWGLIYLLLILYVFVPLKDWNSVSGNAYGWLVRSNPWFLLSCAANAGWIFLWHYQFVWISVPVMLILLFSLIKITVIQKQNHITSWYYRWPIQVYTGWISVAAIANFTAAFVSSGWEGEPFSEITWAVTMMSVATILAFYFCWTAGDYLYSLVIAWALFGIWIRLESVNRLLAVTALSLSVLIGVIALVRLLQKLRNAPLPK